MNSEVCYEQYTPALLRNNPDKIYVFGDNMKRYGKRGQAIIRDEPNAFGVATKRYPSMDDWAFFSDKYDEYEVVVRDLRELYTLGKEHTIVFPSAWIGTGLANMKERSPGVWSEMSFILKTHFGYDNEVSEK